MLIVGGSMQFTEYEKNQLIDLMKTYMKLKDVNLFPVLNEVVDALELGAINDAYQARYLRDAIYSSEETKEKFKELDEKLEKAYF